MKLGTVHLKSGRGAGRYEGRVISNIIFEGGLKFITPVLGGYEFSNIKFVGFVLPNILHYNSSKPPPYFLLTEVIIIFLGCMLDRSMAVISTKTIKQFDKTDGITARR